MTQPPAPGVAQSLLGAVDWSAHPLGPRELWPISLSALLRSMLASAESMYLVWGPERTFFFNDAYVPLLGPRVSAAMGARFEELWADAYSAVAPLFLQAMAGRASRTVDMLIPMARHGEPETAWFTFSFTPAFDDEGAVAGVLCIVNETTATVRQAEAERRAAAALAESEGRLRQAEEAGRIGVFAIEIASGMLTGTPQFFDLFGLGARTEVEAAVIEAMVLPEDAEAVSRAETRASGDVALNVEYRIRRPDTGEVRCIERRAEFECDAAGRRLRLVGVVQDVTERRNDRDALARLNATLEATVVERTQALLLHENIVQSDTTPICAFDADCRLIAFNQAHDDEFFRVNGFHSRIGDVFWELFVPEQQPVMKALMSRALAGEPFTVEAEFGNPQIDAPRWEIHYSPLRDASGRVFGAFHHARDISARLRAQAELELAQEALRRSQKMEAMGQLTGGVAHDFNNLLTPIVGALDMLQRRGVGGEREQRLIAGAAQSAERARTLVHRLLAFARRQPLQPVAVDTARLIHGMADLVASTIGPQIRVVVETAEHLPPASADPNQLEMALLNLAVNARDAMPEGGVLRIVATAERVDAPDAAGMKPGRYVRLSVADTGVGMDEATLARAVEPFFSTKGVGKGTGLGLSMAHGLASQLGGALRLASAEGQGTQVELWLPASAAAAPAAAAPPPVVPRVPTLRGTALLVDDEESVRVSTADMLAELGFDVVEAASADAALALLDGDLTLDVIITDHLMPGMTGSDLARAVQARRPSLPVLVISGYAESEGIEPDLPRLSKPFRRDELISSLAALG